MHELIYSYRVQIADEEDNAITIRQARTLTNTERQLVRAAAAKPGADVEIVDVDVVSFLGDEMIDSAQWND